MVLIPILRSDQGLGITSPNAGWQSWSKSGKLWCTCGAHASILNQWCWFRFWGQIKDWGITSPNAGWQSWSKSGKLWCTCGAHASILNQWCWFRFWGQIKDWGITSPNAGWQFWSKSGKLWCTCAAHASILNQWCWFRFWGQINDISFFIDLQTSNRHQKYQGLRKNSKFSFLFNVASDQQSALEISGT